eukprot:2442629-Rhodomonas_salina.1
MAGDSGGHLDIGADVPAEPSHQAPIMTANDAASSEGLDMMIGGAGGEFDSEGVGGAFRFEQPD